MQNYGISPRLYFSDEQFKVLHGFKLSQVDGEGLQALPPSIKNSAGSEAIELMQTPFSEFAFNHIEYPSYGDKDCIAQVTGIPINKPDFIADYHYISLARCIDELLMRNFYKGKLKGKFSTPGATK